MTREDIIRMAQEAGGGPTPPDFLIPVFERFAAIVASAECEMNVKALEEQIGWDMDDPSSTAVKVIQARGRA